MYVSAIWASYSEIHCTECEHCPEKFIIPQT